MTNDDLAGALRRVAISPPMPDVVRALRTGMPDGEEAVATLFGKKGLKYYYIALTRTTLVIALQRFRAPGRAIFALAEIQSLDFADHVEGVEMTVRGNGSWIAIPGIRKDVYLEEFRDATRLVGYGGSSALARGADRARSKSHGSAMQGEDSRQSRQPKGESEDSPIEPPPGHGDLMGTLERLVALRDSGALTDVEYSVAKERALGIHSDKRLDT